MRHAACGSIVIAFGVMPGCGNTVDYFGLPASTEGIDTLPMSSSTGTAASTTTMATETTGATPSSTADSGSSSSGEVGSGSTAAACTDPCARLDMLVVLDNTDANAEVRSGLVMNTDALALVVTEPGRPWANDFHVGFVPTNDGGTLAQCRVTGALSATPRSDQPIPCVSSSGANWADQDDAALALVLQCMANLEPVGPPDPPRPIALAAARGLGIAVPADPMANDVITACNDGFARSDSLKVVAIVAAADDPGGGVGSPGTAMDWAGWMDLADADPCTPLVVVGVVPSIPLVCGPVADNVVSWVGLVQAGVASDWCEFRETQGVSGLQDLGTILDEVCG